MRRPSRLLPKRPWGSEVMESLGQGRGGDQIGIVAVSLYGGLERGMGPTRYFGYKVTSNRMEGPKHGINRARRAY